jgi:hypothetical protein
MDGYLHSSGCWAAGVHWWVRDNLLRQDSYFLRTLCRARCNPAVMITTRHVTPIEPRNFGRSFDRCIVAARVRRIKVRGSRKTCASLLAALDVHPRAAMRILRHSKIGKHSGPWFFSLWGPARAEQRPRCRSAECAVLLTQGRL